MQTSIKACAHTPVAYNEETTQPIVRKVCGHNVYKGNVFVCVLKENGEKIIKKIGILTTELDSLGEMLISLDYINYY